MTLKELRAGKFNRVEIRRNAAGHPEVLIDGRKVERCTGFKVESVDPRGSLLNVTVSFYSGHVEVDDAHPTPELADLVDDAWDPVSAPAPSWRERIQERGEDTP